MVNSRHEQLASVEFITTFRLDHTSLARPLVSIVG